MIKQIQSLIARYALKGVLVDSNLLLLFLIGATDKNLIGHFKRTEKYTVEDYDLLSSILNQFIWRCTTPNVLTEVSNLANALSGETKYKFFQVLSEEIKILDERYIPSEEVSRNYEFIKFGLTDSVLSLLATKGLLLVTDDFPIAQYIASAKLDVINFTHVRHAFGII